jgi:hypothetical protein
MTLARRSSRAAPWVVAAVLAVGLCAIGLAWVLEPAFVPASILARLGLLVAGFVAAIASFVLLNMQFLRDSGGGRKYIEALSQIDPALTTPETLADSLPELPAGHPMADGFARLRECFVMLSEKLAEAEHVEHHEFGAGCWFSSHVSVSHCELATPKPGATARLRLRRGLLPSE